MGFFAWLFGRRKESKPRHAPPRSRGQGQREHDDLIAGYRFYANLVPRTPLWVLEQHGAFHREPAFQVDPTDGVWVPELASWQAFALAVDECPAGMMDSMVGQIPVDGGDFLPFLKAFRGIVESDASVDEQIAQLRGLYDTDPRFPQFRAHLGDDIARKWFCAQLTSLPGLGPRAAELLFDGGFRTPEEVMAASDEELLSVKGVGKDTLAKIRASDT